MSWKTRFDEQQRAIRDIMAAGFSLEDQGHGSHALLQYRTACQEILALGAMLEAHIIGFGEDGDVEEDGGPVARLAQALGYKARVYAVGMEVLVSEARDLLEKGVDPSLKMPVDNEIKREVPRDE